VIFSLCWIAGWTTFRVVRCSSVSVARMNGEYALGA
jgi:hypothetical protein